MLIDAAFNDITGQIINAAVEVHGLAGPGLLGSNYAPCLKCELSARGLRFESERAVPPVNTGVPLGTSYRVLIVAASSPK